MAILLDGGESESANCHSVADGAEQYRRNKVGVRQIRHGKVLCAERQVLCRTVEGIGSFGAIMEFNVFKEHTAVIYMVLAAAPQPLVGSEQIQRRKQCVICLGDVLGGKCKSCPMLFIYICHWFVLAFYIFVESLAEGRTAYLPHGGCQHLCGGGGGCRDEYLCFGKTEAHASRCKIRNGHHQPFMRLSCGLSENIVIFSPCEIEKALRFLCNRRAIDSITYSVVGPLSVQRSAARLQERGIRP